MPLAAKSLIHVYWPACLGLALAACARAPSDLVQLPDEKSSRADEDDDGEEASEASEEDDEADVEEDDDVAEDEGDDQMSTSEETSNDDEAEAPEGDQSSMPEVRAPAGGSGGRDAGSAMSDDESVASAECAGEYTADDACSMCLCAKCASQIENCYASSDSTKNQQCSAIQECAEQNQCASTECYCGASTLCLSPAGPCVAVIESAAGSAARVSAAADDPENPVGRADAVGMCALSNCLSECGLTAPRS